jgi:formylglycine-generating enzyme required for sulfatase activity
VIGNGKYSTGPLRNPANDATDMAAALREIGFKVILATDANRKAMFQLIDQFGSEIRGADLALFYYSGHGVQEAGENYLIPVGADITAASDVELEGVQLQRLIARMNSGGAGTNVVILDACRNNPFPQAARGVERGLAVVGQKPPESVIVYATEAGETAEDGGGRNGVFTAALLKNIKRNDELTSILRDVNAEVRQATNQKQKPAKYDNLTRDVYLTGLAAASPAAGAAASAPAAAARKARGSLAVSVSVEGELFVDGKNVGELPAGGQATIPDIEVGDRALALRYSDGQVEKAVATVLEGRSTSVVFGYRQGQGDRQGPGASKAAPQAASGSLPANFILVPGGTFTMGSPSNEQYRDKNEVQHQVSLSPFAISKYDVTFEEYDAYCEATGAEKPDDSGWGRGSRPVINVSWYEAVAYCNWRSQQEGRTPAYTISGKEVSWGRSANGYRLPTEAEWEYAAKGGPQASSLAVNAVYAGSSNLGQVAWHLGNSENKTHPVGQKAANSLGLYDMAGNVWQWCWDWYGSYRTGSQSDPRGPASGGFLVLRVVRGGGWGDSVRYLRSAFRGSGEPGYRFFNCRGFRLVASQLDQ